MRAILAILALAFMAPAALATEPDSQVIGKDGQLFLRQEVVLETSVAEAWGFFTTAEGTMRWMAPMVQIDLRAGGAIRSHYDAKAKIGDPGTIETRIVNYVPERLLTLQADLAPVKADWLNDTIRAEAHNLYNVIQFEPLGPNRTRIVSWGIGYRDDEAWKPMLDFFKRANRWTFGELQKAAQSSRPSNISPEMDAGDPLEALRFLVGKCWRGQFGDGPAYDMMCAEAMPGGHIRSRHVVRGVPTDYRGETIYYFDGERQKIRYHYYTSLGALAQGDIAVQPDGALRFDNGRYAFPDGKSLSMRGSQKRLSDGGLAHENWLLKDGKWEKQEPMTLYPSACGDWAAVEAGCE